MQVMYFLGVYDEQSFDKSELIEFKILTLSR